MTENINLNHSDNHGLKPLIINCLHNYYSIIMSGCSKDDDINNTIAHTPPFCSFIDPNDNSKFTQGVEITINVITKGRDSDLAIERFLINDEVVYEINSSMNDWYTYNWQTNDENPGLYEIRFQAIDSAEAISEDTILIELLLADTINDIDGNRYRTIQIGEQTWMAKNLKTTTYKDGTPIELVTNNNNWSEDSIGAYCWYNNDEEIGNIYGALYNYYAVETNKICPDGWHVPTNE